MTGTMAITMAGLGSRFAKAGYDRPKYEIEVRGRPLFDWSMISLQSFLDAGWTFRFAVRSGTGARDYIARRASVLDMRVGDVLELEAVTDGQATTALLLTENAPADRPLAVYNIDTFVRPYAMSPPAPSACAGWVPCFPGPGDGWSFARLDGAGRVVEMREKVRISNHATVGLYWFDSARRYRDAYKTYFARPGTEERGERYIAPLYNQLIEDGALVRIASLAFGDVGMLGTPEQVRAFGQDPPPGTIGYIGNDRHP